MCQHTVARHQVLARSRQQGSATARSTPVAPNPTCVVPSRHVFFSEHATRPSGRIDKRLSVIAGRPAYLDKCSSHFRSPAETRTAPCNEKPSKLAHSGRFTNGSLRVPPPTRTSRWPARSPDNATPCTAAASSSSSSCSPTSPPHDTSASLASASSGHLPICRNLRRTRSRTRRTSKATSASVTCACPHHSSPPRPSSYELTDSAIASCALCAGAKLRTNY
jgi:hypothetical protein